MNRSDNHHLETVLKRRAFESPSEGFITRILAHSCRMSQIRELSLSEWLRQLLSEFKLLEPAYVVASLLIIGCAVGASFSFAENSISTSETVYLPELFDDEGVVL